MFDFVAFYPQTDLIAERKFGIFSLLNDETKMPHPSVRNFTINIHNTWKSSTVLIRHTQNVSDGFMVRHFAGDVFYKTVFYLLH